MPRWWAFDFRSLLLDDVLDATAKLLIAQMTGYTAVIQDAGTDTSALDWFEIVPLSNHDALAVLTLMNQSLSLSSLPFQRI